jgi:hypothetical protein
MRHPEEPRLLRPALFALAALGAAGLAATAHAPRPDDLRLALLCLLGATGIPGAVSLAGRDAMPVFRITLAAGIMAWFVGSGRIALGAMVESLDRWPLLAGGLALVGVQPFCGAWRWQWILRHQEIELSYRESLRLVFVTFFFNICLPGATGGDIVRGYTVGKEAGKGAETVTSLILDRLTGMGALLGLCAAMLLWNLPLILSKPDFREAALLLAAMVAGGAVFLVLAMSRTLANLLRRTPLARIPFPGRASAGRAYRAMHSYHESRGTLLAATGISVVAHGAMIGAVICFSYALRVPGITLAQYFVLAPLGLTFNGIPVTPGGVGQGQTAFHWLYGEVGGLGAAKLGASVMTFMHLSLFALAGVGAVVYASGRHRLMARVNPADGRPAPETVE